MKKHPIKYIHQYGITLYLYQIIILFLNKFHMLTKTKNNLVVKKNNLAIKKLEEKYNYIIDKYKKKQRKKYHNSNKVWVLWWQGQNEMPELCKICLESMHKNLINSDIVVLTKKNIRDYVTLPSYIIEHYEKGEISKAHFSDIIRMNLLKDYGGIWLDATIYVSKPITNNKLKEIKTIKFKCSDKTSISKGKWCGFVLGEFNPQLYEYISEFYLEYWKHHNIIIDYFLMDYIIYIGYKNINWFKEEIESNKNNNENIHMLQKELNSKYNFAEWQKINENTLHKLNYKIPTTYMVNNNLTFYGYIAKGGEDCEK